MALQTITVKLAGTRPLILHNGLMANPLSKIAKAMKELTSKRSKTDTDYLQIGNLEWLASWYFSGNQLEFAVGATDIAVGDHGEFIIPDYVLDAMIVNGAKKNKLGMQFKSGTFTESDGILEFEGRDNIEKMMTDPNLRIETLETVGNARILRTRPYLKQWSVEFLFNYDDTVVNLGQVEQALDMAGRLVGLCERRPRQGRFTYAISKNGKGK